VAYNRLGKRANRRLSTTRLIVLTSLGCLAAAWLLRLVGPVYGLTREVMGPVTGSAMVAELGVATLVFLLPTFGMGALFSHLAQAMRDRYAGIGRALAVNTLGAAFAPLLFGVVALPALGAKAALVGIALGYLTVLALVPARLDAWPLLPAIAGALLGDCRHCP
jgi:spermidine synthase